MAFPVEHVETSTIRPPTGGRHGLSIEALREREASKAQRVRLERSAINSALTPPRLSRYGRAERLAQEKALMTQSHPPLLQHSHRNESTPAPSPPGTVAYGTDRPPPEEAKCPITLDYFYEPVVLPSGNRYELSSLALWVSEHGSEPLTRLPYDFSIPLTIDEDMKCTAHCTEMSWRSHSRVLQG